MENLHRRILPWLREGGATEHDIHQMLVDNPARILAPGPLSDGGGVSAEVGAEDEGPPQRALGSGRRT